MKNLLLLTLLYFATLSAAQAQPYYWIGFGDNWSTTTAWSTSPGGADCGCVPDDADDVIFDGNSGDCVIDVELSGRTGAFTMEAGYGGVITYAGFFSLNASAFTIEDGTYDATGAGSHIIGDVTVSGGTFELSDAVGAHEFISFSISGGVFNGGQEQIVIAGPFNLSGGTFNSTSGELTLDNSTTQLINNTGGTFNHNGGIVFLNITNGTRSITSGLTFNDLTVSNGSTTINRSLNIGSGTTTVNGTLTIISQTARTVSFSGGGSFNLNGSLDLSSHNGNANPSFGTTVFNFTASSGTSIITGNAVVGNGKIPPVNINQTGTASLTLDGFINVYGNWTYNNATTVNPGTSTVTFYSPNGSTIRTVDAEGSAGSMSFNNLNVGTGSGSTNTGFVTLAGNLVTTGALTIGTSCAMTTAGFSVSVGGNFTNNGTLTPSTSTFTLTGSSTQSIDFRSSTDVTLNTLICNKTSGTATIMDAVSISNLLTSSGGTLNTNGQLTLLSTASQTAQVGNSSGSFSGTAMIQRHIPSVGKRWRFLAAPVLSGPTVENSWQQQIFVTGPGTGSGPVGTANFNSNGFDWTSINPSSMYTYNENQSIDFNSRWAGFANNQVTLAAGTGYRVYVRGDRSDAGRLDNTVNTQNEVTLSVTGTIPRGNQNFAITCSNGCGLDDGWNLVGNPYPATLDWNSVSTSNSSNISGTYYIYNPSTNAMVSWNGTTGDAGRYISSGQSFWVKKTTSGSNNILFTESHKSTSQAGGQLFKTNPEIQNLLKITLSGTSFSNNAYVHLNGTGQYGLDRYDAYKMSFASGQIATFEPGSTIRYDINNLPLFGTKTIDTIEVDANVSAAAANYTLTFNNMASFDANVNVVLEDKLTHTLQDLKVNDTYSYATNGSAASTGNRFRILVAGINTSLPVTFTSVQAKLAGKAVNVVWNTASEKNNARFVVEHSVDGKTFVEIGTVKGAGNSNSVVAYSFVHKSPEQNSINYYRLRQVDFDGRYAYSNVCFVSLYDNSQAVSGKGQESPGTMIVYPSPAKETLSVEGVEGDYVSVEVANLYGAKVLVKRQEAVNGVVVLDVNSLKQGTYVISIVDDMGTVHRQKFVKE